MKWRKQQIDRAIDSALEREEQEHEPSYKDVPYKAARIMQLRAGRADDSALQAVQQQMKKR